jgi:hypothetical protein
MVDLTFRTLGAWGAGKGANLEPSEVDSNFWSLAQAIYDLQANPADPIGIATITVSGTQMTITLTDGTVLGPYTLPVLTFRWRGEWTPGTAYAVLDVVTVTGTGIFMCQVAHTSPPTFDLSQIIGGTQVWYFLFGAVGAPIAPTAVDYLYVGDGLDPDGGIQFGDLTAQRLFANDPGGILIINHQPGDTLPPAPISNSTMSFLRLCGQNGEWVTASLESWGSGVPNLIFRHAAGTRAAPSNNMLGDSLGRISWRGYGASGYTPDIAWMRALPLENFTGAAQGTQFEFVTQAVGTAGNSGLVTQAQLGPGLTVGHPTAPSGGMLVGDINATRIMVNGVAVGTSGTGLPDAPNDGTAYGRQSAAWQRVLALTGGTVSGSLAVGAPGLPSGGLVNGDIASQRLIISNNAVDPPAPTYATARLWMIGNTGEGLLAHLDASATMASLSYRRANGTTAAPTNVNSGDGLGAIAFRGYGATGYLATPSARMQVSALEPFTDIAAGAQFQFTANLQGTVSLSTLALIGPGLAVGAPSPMPSDYQRGDIIGQRLFAGGASAFLQVNGNAGALPVAPSPTMSLRLAAIDGQGANASMESWGSNSLLFFRRAQGTAVAPTALLSGTNMGALIWRGYGTTGYGGNNARIVAFTLEDWTDAAQGSQLQFQATPVGSTASATVAALGPGLTVGSPTPPAGGLLFGDLNATRVLVNGVPVGVTGGGLSDAPSDGTSYGRLNAAWQRVLPLTGGSVSGALLTAAYLQAGTAGAPVGGAIAGDVIGGRLLVNENAATMPPLALSTTGVQANGADGANFDGLLIDAHGGSANVRMRRAGGTGTTPSAVLNGDIIGQLSWAGYGATGYVSAVAARVQITATENWSDTARASRIDIGTAAPAGGAFTTQLSIGPGLTVGAPAAVGGGALVGDVNAQRYLQNGLPFTATGLSTAGGTISGTAPGSLTINRNAVLPAPTAGVVSALWIIGNDAENPAFAMDAFGQPGGIIYRRSNGTAGSPSAVLSGQSIGNIAFRGFGTTSVVPQAAARISGNALENFTDTTLGAQLVFTTVTPGSLTLVDQMKVGPGVVIGAPPDGVLGAGTLNTAGLQQINGNTVAAPAIGSATQYIRVIGADAVQPRVTIDAFAGTPHFDMRKSNGTAASPTGLNPGDSMGVVGWFGHAGAAGYIAAARASIGANSLDTMDATHQGAQLLFAAAPAGATAIATIATMGPGINVGAATAPAGGDQAGDVNALRLLVNGIGYVFGFSAPSGVLTASQVLGHHSVQRAITFPANFAGSRAGGTANATASTVITIATATSGTGTWTTIGTITFAAGSITPTFATTGGLAQSVAAGSVVRAIGPATADTTFANFFCTLAAA